METPMEYGNFSFLYCKNWFIYSIISARFYKIVLRRMAIDRYSAVYLLIYS